MLSIQENDKISRVGPGTPMGELMRRYWHPIAAAAELDDKPTKPVRLLGEDLVLYKDKSGTLGPHRAVSAPHRRVDLSYGIPEESGLRCMYHGWMMDETGQCIEQPFEETVHPDGRFKEKVKVAGYPVQVLAGMVFAYMGPAPAPLLPNWEPFTWEDGWSEVALAPLPCNWLQCMENSLDPVPPRMAPRLLGRPPSSTTRPSGSDWPRPTSSASSPSATRRSGSTCSTTASSSAALPRASTRPTATGPSATP